MAEPSSEPATMDDARLVAAHEQLLAYARDLRGALARSRAVADELSRTHLETVAALAAAIDVRDEVTGGHVYRVANYGLVLAEELAPELATDPQLVYGFLLHDIGKLGVPDDVLNKPEPLDEREQAIMRRHVEYGVRFVEQVSFLRPALHVVATHHERWDGDGYPRGLAGEAIPLTTRMFAVCDAYDAMVHDRPYRRAMAPDEALEQLRLGAGTQFDPDVVRGFQAALDRIAAVDERPAVPQVTLPVSARLARGSVDRSLVWEALDDGLLLLSPDGVITDANPAFVELFGLPAPPIGMTLQEFVERTADRFAEPDLARARALAVSSDLFQARSELEFGLVHPARRRVHRVAHTLKGEDGNVTGRLLVFRVLDDEGSTAGH